MYVCMCVLSQVQLFVTPWTVACQAPLSQISQARILERVAISFSRRSSPPREQTCVSCVSCTGKRILLPPSHLGSSY